MFKYLFFLVLGLTTQISNAGDKVGNGGGLWTCTSQRILQQGVLVDLYEATEEFGLSLISTNSFTPMQIVEDRKNFLRNSLPVYFYHWDRTLALVLEKIRYVNSELTIVDDALYRVRPLANTCNEAWLYSQFANFTNQDQILVRADLWNSSKIKAIDKAALIWHEVIYAWLRDLHHDKDSVRARQMVGLLFSTLPASEIARRFELVMSNRPTEPNQPLWFCMIKNNLNFRYFGDYGTVEVEAKVKTKQRCQSAQSGFHCSDSSLLCEKIESSTVGRSCSLENHLSGKTFFGSGRIKLEAEFKARDQCQAISGTDPLHCDSSVDCQ
jgi:hypothetical protein